jgi:hypothetical protein
VRRLAIALVLSACGAGSAPPPEAPRPVRIADHTTETAPESEPAVVPVPPRAADGPTAAPPPVEPATGE